MRSTWAGTIAYLGLVALVCSWVALTVDARSSEVLGEVTRTMGVALGVAAPAAFVVAYVLHRRSRTFVDVVVDVGGDRITTIELQTLREQTAPDRMIWMFAKCGFEAGAAQGVREGGIRCLSPTGSTFFDPPEALTRPRSTAARTPPTSPAGSPPAVASPATARRRRNPSRPRVQIGGHGRRSAQTLRPDSQ